MRDSLQHKRSDDHNDTITGNEDDDVEEGQSLLREEFGFDDSALPTYHEPSRTRSFWNIWYGPDSPRPLAIRPIFPLLQKAPLKLLDAHGSKKYILLGTTLFLWFLFFTVFLHSQLPIRNGDGNYVLNLDCTDTLWRRKNECGVDGIDCRPFSNQSFAFRCPAKCSDVKILNPHVVGPDEYNYRPLVIGKGPYRGDSFICASAIHAGIVKDLTGGCGRVSRVGGHDHFASTMHNGIESIPFDSSFPLSFSVTVDENVACNSDLRSAFLPISLLFTAALAIFSTSPTIFFPIFVLIFAHVSFVSDPPTASYRNITVLPDHISMFAKRLLPAMFVAVVIYSTTIKRTLSGLTAQFEKAMLWLGGFWVGALSNYTFDWIPISRLTAHDLEQQPGAKLALAIIILLLVVIVVGQVYSFWLEGRLPRYLGLYGFFILAIILCLTIPGVNLRIHHYILALLFLPGTSLQTRPSLLYQGILLGLFVNGIARWDFDSVLQTSDALRADARLDSAVPQLFDPTIIFGSEGLSATFSFKAIPDDINGISVLINDVERERTFRDETSGIFTPFGWTRTVELGLHEYFRFAFIESGRTLDYSPPGTLFNNGSWRSGEHNSKLITPGGVPPYLDWGNNSTVMGKPDV
jgi:hypothetical protein